MNSSFLPPATASAQIAARVLTGLRSAAPDLRIPAPFGCPSSSLTPLPGAKPPPRRSLVDACRIGFEVVPANSPGLMEEVHRLRYQIYCTENRFEDPCDHPNGLERDRFDGHSAHCLLRYRPSGIFIGTVRLILPLPETPQASFSVQQACSDPIVCDPRRFPSVSTGEISRICISRERRRQCEADPEIMQHAFVGLAQASVRLSVENGISHWFGLMEPIFIKRVARLGIYFDKIGEPVDYHGKRQPVSASLATMLATVHRLQPEVWEVMTDQGRMWPLDRAAVA